MLKRERDEWMVDRCDFWADLVIRDLYVCLRIIVKFSGQVKGGERLDGWSRGEIYPTFLGTFQDLV